MKRLVIPVKRMMVLCKAKFLKKIKDSKGKWHYYYHEEKKEKGYVPSFSAKLLSDAKKYVRDLKEMQELRDDDRYNPRASADANRLDVSLQERHKKLLPKLHKELVDAVKQRMHYTKPSQERSADRTYLLNKKLPAELVAVLNQDRKRKIEIDETGRRLTFKH